MDKARFLSLYNVGLNDTEIAAELGVSLPTVGKHRRKLGLPRNRKETVTGRILALHNLGIQDEEIAKQVGWKARSVRCWIARNAEIKIPVKKKSSRPKGELLAALGERYAVESTWNIG